MDMIMDKLLLGPHEAPEVLAVGRSRVCDLMRPHQVPASRWDVQTHTG
jgi:hypothetical protein